MKFVECLELFMADEKTEGVVMIGEIGGTAEVDAAEFIKKRKKQTRCCFYCRRYSATRKKNGPRWSYSL